MLAKAVITFLLLTLFAPLLLAQQDTLNPVCKLLKLNSNWGFGAGARYSFLDFDEMNRSLEAAGLPGLESPVACLDMALRTSCSWRYLMVETGLKFSFGSSSENNLGNRQSVTFRDYALQSRLMFDVFRDNRFSKIFPFAGLGVSYQTLRTSSSDAADFGNSSASSSASNLDRRFTYIPFSFETGLSLEQGVKMFGKDVFVGFRGGYAFRFFQTQWSLEENQSVNLPTPAASSPFLGVILRVKSSPKQICETRLSK
jgi:hypothetical protein